MQTELFHESINDAFRSAVAMMGGFEAVGIEIWPAKSRKGAGSLLSDVLSVERNNKFSLEETAHFMRIARDRGIHLPMHFLCDEVGYDRPHAVDAADQEAEVARQMEAAAATFKGAVKRFERLQSAQPASRIPALKTALKPAK